ncbi:MAG: hypothetical protein H7123_04540 [Thermoleophilia bacterium]|nr:hypothetical protein [Thermoleophilia bacterium]
MISMTPRRRLDSDCGQATLEQLGLIGAILILLTAVAASFATGDRGAAGTQLAGAIGKRVVAAVARGDTSVSLGSSHVRESHRQGVAVGTGSARPPRLTDLQMHEIGPQFAWRSYGVAHTYTSLPGGTQPKRLEHQLPGASGTIEGGLCFLCLGTTARAEYALGGAAHAAGKGVHSTDLIGVDTLVRAHLALMHATVSATGALQAFGVHVTARSTASGTAGIDGSLAARLELGRLHQALVLEAGAVAGLAGHVEQRASVKLAGVAVHATAGADGWVGAGLTGRLHVGHEGAGKFSWDIGAGAGLGLGGGAHVAGTLDLSAAMHEHPNIIAGILGNSLLGLPANSAAPALVRMATHDARLPARHRTTKYGAGK